MDKYTGYNLDSYVQDMSDEEFIRLLRDYKKLTASEEKVRFVYRHFGPYYLWHYGGRMVKGEFEWIGFPPDEEFNPGKTENLANEIINFYVAETKGAHFNGLKEALARRAEKCQSVAEVKRLLQVELNDLQEKEAHCKESDDPAERAWFEGYRCEALKSWIDFWPATGTSCYQAATGSAERLLEIELQQQLKEIEEAEGVAEDTKVYPLGNQYVIILYFIYSGLLDKLKEQIGNNDSALSRALAAITGADAPSLRQQLIRYKYGYRDPRSRNLFKEEHVLKAIDTLKTTKLDPSELQKIYEEL